MSDVITDYFKLEDRSLNFEVIGELSKKPGYFKFGPENICFARSSKRALSATPNGHLHDYIRDVDYRGSTPLLPFDPNEVIGNFRYETYMGSLHHQRRRAAQTPIRTAYYWLRPALHLSIRKRLQKLHLNGWNELTFPQWPVDRTVDRLAETLLGLAMQGGGVERKPFIWFWPEGASACALMTHDIETKAGYNFCPQLMDINEKYGIPASFQVVPEKRYSVSEAFIDDIWKRGFEVNIQDLNHDGKLFGDWKEFRERVAKINYYGKKYGAKGFRSAILYRNQEWYTELEFEYDMTVPNVAHLDPQRGGCCTVMPYFIGNVLELPLTTTQDYSLLHILNDYSLNLWKQQVELILEHHGLISFIVHPDYIISKKPQQTYRNLLELLRELHLKRNVWLARPGEVNDWWRKRSKMRLLRRGDKWSVEGSGSEKARVAFATRGADGGMCYELAQSICEMRT